LPGLTIEARDQILKTLPGAIQIAEQTLEWFVAQLERFTEEIAFFANFPTLYMGLVGQNGELETYDGQLRLVDQGQAIVAQINPTEYRTIIEEHVEGHSFLKSPFYKPLGYPKGIYRVGPLARLHMASKCGTPRADAALAAFKQTEHRSSFYYHYARLIEIIFAFEMIEQLLNEPDILDSHVRAHASPNRQEGIGVAEAPRGTLIHHYRIDENGLINYVNLVIATGHNNLAMNQGVKQVAQHFIKGARITDGMLNRVEAVIRTYDPCLSCSTHAVGQMPLHIQLIAPDGTIVDEVKR